MTNSRVGGLITQPPPPRLLFDGALFEVSETHCASSCHRVYRLFKKEFYAMTQNIRDDVLRELEIPKFYIQVDLFANHKNALEEI